ncbi:helix-turn-helix domain-containing protein [Victivallaceae bacterium BBE-744-WT-12]|uniref:Helix-turn-helix domain-containing protein n=1 Tax=Victivallis lenta TaxID=2606640 RepID=A0A844G7U8_9BACT|nr:helix-turn-helix domain-containing protein [Victivallis lenta]MST99243.1 helix-turn-helix domain-containing protein [Victivallis lenta]
MQARLQTETTKQHQGEKSMRIQNQSHAIVLNTAVNLLREYYSGLTSEQLHAALSHSEIQGSIQKKLTRRECAELLGVSVNSVNRYIKNGKLKTVNISPRLVRIDPESVRELLNHGVPEDEIIVPQCHGKEAAR